MRKYFSFLSVAIFPALIFLSTTVFADTIAQENQHVPDEIMVGVNATDNFENDFQKIEEMNMRCETKVEKSIRYIDTTRDIYHMLLKINNGHSVEDAIRCWKQFPYTNFAQPNFILNQDK